jgi:hypothetical protein
MVLVRCGVDDRTTRRVAVAVVLAAVAACGGGSSEPPDRPVGSLAPRADDELEPRSRTTTCAAALARVEELVGGDLGRALAVAPISGFDRLATREAWQGGCPRFSPWVRRCLVLSTAREQLATCSPENEPWSRRHEFGGVPPDEAARFLACIDGAQDRAAFDLCGYAP